MLHSQMSKASFFAYINVVTEMAWILSTIRLRFDAMTSEKQGTVVKRNCPVYLEVASATAGVGVLGLKPEQKVLSFRNALNKLTV